MISVHVQRRKQQHRSRSALDADPYFVHAALLQAQRTWKDPCFNETGEDYESKDLQ